MKLPVVATWPASMQHPAQPRAQGELWANPYSYVMCHAIFLCS